MLQSYLRHAWPGLALVVVGAALAGFGRDSTTVSAIGFALAGVGAVVLVAVGFWEIGASEDRERAAEQARRPRP